MESFISLCQDYLTYSEKVNFTALLIGICEAEVLVIFSDIYVTDFVSMSKTTWEVSGPTDVYIVAYVRKLTGFDYNIPDE